MRVCGLYAVLFFFCFALFSGGVQASAPMDQAVTDALKQASKGQWTQAEASISRLNNPAARSALDWYRYTRGNSGHAFESTTRFVDKHSHWPMLDKIKLEAEKSLTSNTPDQNVVQWFDRNAPLTGQAMDVYVSSLLSHQRIYDARQVLRNWWAEASLGRDQQKSFFAKYGSYLDRESHIKRLNYLLHSGQYSNAQGVAEVLGNGYPELAAARQGLAQSAANVNSLVAAVPSSLKNDAGLMYERLRWRRKNDLDDGAIEILNQAPSFSAMYDPSAWWKERHILVRRLIEKRQYKKAYQLVSAHKQKEGFPLAQAEWVSGWLAINFINEPWKAFEHFEKLYKNVSSPISKSRGAYWAGRASENLKHPEIALQWYNVGASYPETFYGQLSAEKINLKLPLNDGDAVYSAQQKNIFDQKDVVRAAKWFGAAGLKQQSAVFLIRLSKDAKSAADYILAADLANALGQRDIAIKIAQDLQKEKNVTLNKYLYPEITHELKDVRNAEWAFVSAIIRQESRFDHEAVSSAGARGLMQLMPATAKEVASRHGISHQQAWLTSRPSHNIALGSRYLSQMVERFDGNYAMAAAAYNAGPNRVARWVQEFGDPRKGEVELIDWIELIPIYETRNYVQRVLEGVHVYRYRLKGKQAPAVTPIHVAAK